MNLLKGATEDIATIIAVFRSVTGSVRRGLRDVETPPDAPMTDDTLRKSK
jgi:hypothetical protein